MGKQDVVFSSLHVNVGFFCEKIFLKACQPKEALKQKGNNIHL